LPCTPELQSDSEIDVSSCPAGDEVLENDTRHLISRFLRDFTGLSKSQWNENTHTMVCSTNCHWMTEQMMPVLSAQ
ncbi:hypothetical protein T09_3628, partial [Trichinella sp. T9]